MSLSEQRHPGAPFLPADFVERLQRNYVADRRITLQMICVMVAGLAVGVGLMGAGLILGWPAWTRTAASGLTVAIAWCAYLVTRRRSHAESVKLDFRCPHCNAPLFAKGPLWSAANEEMGTGEPGWCSKCFNRLDSPVLPEKS